MPVTTMEERFTIDCSFCGFLTTETTFAKAWETARRLALRHKASDEKITIFDRLAQRGACNTWDIEGHCIGYKEWREPSYLKERIPATSPHPVVLERYPLGAVPEKIPIGGLDVPIPPLRGTELPPKKPRVVAANAVLRTNEKFDSSVKHLGYEPVNLSQEELEALDKPIPTDVEIINDSQKRLRNTTVVPDEKLNSRQLSHLKLARVIAKDIFHIPGSIYAAIIPPASDRVRTAGLYGTTTGIIYINLDQLSSGRNMIDTLIHELGHHQQHQQTNKAEDLSPEHAEAMTLVASRVVDDVSKGKFDELLKEISW
jgi:hypothetical protein